MNRSDLLSLAAIVVSILSVIATIVGALAAINANYIASQANTIAKESKSESSANSEADRQLQRSIAEMQQLAKRPALQLLRFSQIAERECYATVQNTGERYVAMFEVVCQDSEHDMRGSIPGTVAIIPKANSSDVVKINFENTQQRTHSFQPPVKVAPGEILTFKLSVSQDFRSGDFVLLFNANDHIHLGQLTSQSQIDPFSPFGAFEPPVPGQ